MKKITTEEFIEKSREAHGDRYDYSLVQYTGRNNLVKIICPEHGVIEQRAGSHLANNKCRLCSNNNIKYTTNQFIDKSKKIHGGRYDYSNVDYKNTKTQVKIICSKHGLFKQKPSNHLMGSGCLKCHRIKSAEKRSLTTEKFIKEVKEIHGNLYDYSNSIYKNAKTKIKIICPKHGVFRQTPNAHKSGKGCAKCAHITTAKKRNLTTEEFIKKAKEIHGDKYDYSKSVYNTAKTKVKIICPEHGVFKQTPNSHTQGRGCSTCITSKGENKTRQELIKNNINFIRQHTFEDCRHIYALPFDFYLPDHNTCIEYNGIQHYKPVKYFGGKKAFENQQLRDKIKSDYCKSNNIQLISIRYDECIETKMESI